MLREEQASGAHPAGADRVERHAARGRADGLRKADRLADHGLLVQVGVVLVAALQLFIPGQHRALKARQRVEAAVGNERFRRDGSRRDDASLKCSFHVLASLS